MSSNYIAEKIHLPGFISACICCLIVVACDRQEPTAPEPKPAETKIEKPRAKPSLNLSLEGITTEDKTVNDAAPIEESGELFKKLSQQPKKQGLSVSGKVLLEEDEEHHKTIDGARIDIKGQFD